MDTIPILICIDVEPDDRTINPDIKRDWKGFERSYELFTELRPLLHAQGQSPVRFSWFLRMDPQIAHTYGSPDWVVKRYSSIFAELKSKADEIGLHTHAWRWNPHSQRWFQDFEDQQWVAHCVSTSFEAFQQSFGRHCRSFRFGDHWMNNATLELVESLGAECDLTIEPGRRRADLPDSFTGLFPDYSQAPRSTYTPSRSDFRRRGYEHRRRLREIPISTGPTEWTQSPPASQRKGPSLTYTQNPDQALEGYHDTANCSSITGWVYDKHRPDTPLDVEIYDGDVFVAAVVASTYRLDLVKAGKGNGRHGFKYLLPERLRNGKPHSIRVKVAETDFDLTFTPRDTICPHGRNCRQEDITLNLGDNPGTFSLVMDKLLSVQEKPYLAMVLRSESAVTNETRFCLEDNIQKILWHPLIREFVFETPPEMLKRIGSGSSG